MLIKHLNKNKERNVDRNILGKNPHSGTLITMQLATVLP